MTIDMIHIELTLSTQTIELSIVRAVSEHQISL